jgi:uncharacterized membrane protein HdeD (DUF308 family)
MLIPGPEEEALNPFHIHMPSTTRSIAIGVVLLFAGMVAIAVPFIAGIAASVVFGWLLLIAAAAHLAYAWSERRTGAILWQVLIGIAYLVASLYMLLLPIAGVVTLTLVVAFYIMAEGAFAVVLFFRLRRLRGAGWFLANGIISLILGGLILIYWPLSSLWAVGTLIGVSLLLGGIARIALPMSLPQIHGETGARGSLA